MKPFIGIITLWTPKTLVEKKIHFSQVSLITPFYTPGGLEMMVRSLAQQPSLTTLIMLGNDLAPTPHQSAKKALQTFFTQGVNKKRNLIGFENEVYFDKHISLDVLTLVSQKIEFIDLTHLNLADALTEAQKIIPSLKPGKPLFLKPLTFAFESYQGKYPVSQTSFVISKKNLFLAWVELMYRASRFGLTTFHIHVDCLDLGFEKNTLLTLQNLERYPRKKVSYLGESVHLDTFDAFDFLGFA